MTNPSDIAGLLASLRVRHGDPKPSISTLYDAANLIEKLVAERDEARGNTNVELLARLLTAEQALEAAQAKVGRLAEVHAYLFGVGPLRGCWFGEGKPADERGNFWWRKDLRKALAEGGSNG